MQSARLDSRAPSRGSQSRRVQKWRQKIKKAKNVSGNSSAPWTKRSRSRRSVVCGMKLSTESIFIRSRKTMPRPRKPLSKEKRIELIENRLRNPEIGDKQFASLNHQLSILKGEIVPYAGKPSPKPEPKPEPNSRPTWCTEKWLRIYLIESLGSRPRQQVEPAEKVNGGHAVSAECATQRKTRIAPRIL
jgi:hypothetical protein